MLGLTFIAGRGGFQAKSITMETAMQYTDPQNAPILLNTPFCLITAHDTELKERTGEYQSDFSPIHNDLQANRFIESDTLSMDSIPSNVVVIIMKNIGQEMLGYYSRDRRYRLTPFLGCNIGHAFVPKKHVSGGFYMTSSVGVCYKLKGRQSLSLSIGYELQAYSQLVTHESSMYLTQYVENVSNHAITGSIGFTF